MDSLLQQRFRLVYDSTVAKIPDKVSFSSHVYLRGDNDLSSSDIFKICKDSESKYIIQLKTPKHY